MATGSIGKPKRDMDIFVTGYNRSGKSALINRITGITLAVEGDTYNQTKHQPAKEHSLVYEDKDIKFIDSRGFGDIERPINGKNMEEAMKKVDEVDVVLICHKLYDQIDDRTKKLLEVLALYLGNTLMNRAIVVFTFGDEYIMRTEYKGKNTKNEMENVKNYKMNTIKNLLKKNGINKEVIDKLPSCIVSGTQKKLPTSDNWTADLWGLCNRRCGDGPIGGTRWAQRNPGKTITAGVVGGGGGGASIGAGIGAGIGAVGGPPGMMVGAVIGSVVGVLFGGGVSAAYAKK